MKLDKSKHLLHVATGDYALVMELLNQFNKIYKSNMVYVESVEVDGVMFSYIDISNVSSDHIFLFGSLFGSKVRGLRDKKEIDW